MWLVVIGSWLSWIFSMPKHCSLQFRAHFRPLCVLPLKHLRERMHWQHSQHSQGHPFMKYWFSVTAFWILNLRPQNFSQHNQVGTISEPALQIWQIKIYRNHPWPCHRKPWHRLRVCCSTHFFSNSDFMCCFHILVSDTGYIVRNVI